MEIKDLETFEEFQYFIDFMRGGVFGRGCAI